MPVSPPPSDPAAPVSQLAPEHVDLREATLPAGQPTTAPGPTPQVGRPTPIGVLIEDEPPVLPVVSTTVLDDTATRAREDALRTAYLGPTAGLTLLAAAVTGLHTQLQLSLQLATITALFLIVVALVVFTVGHVIALVMRARHSDNEIRERAAVHDESAPDAPSSELAQRIRAIEVGILEFQQQASRQSISSFRDSRTAMSVALAILGAGAISVLLVPDSSGKLVVGGLTGLGSGFSAFLGKTFLDARNRAIRQLNRAHAVHMAQHLAYFAYQLAERASDETKDMLLKDVVKNTLQGVEPTLAEFLTDTRPPPRTRSRRRGAAAPAPEAGP